MNTKGKGINNLKVFLIGVSILGIGLLIDCLLVYKSIIWPNNLFAQSYTIKGVD